jgi:hypothetical protein
MNSFATKFTVSVTLDPGVPAVLHLDVSDGNVFAFGCSLEGLRRVAETALFSAEEAALDASAPMVPFDVERASAVVSAEPEMVSMSVITTNGTRVPFAMSRDIAEQLSEQLARAVYVCRDPADLKVV